ncbi:MAG: 2-hydroxyacyl-CoA dehydratase [Desulfobacterales bacterium]|nr:2-hydroxyacyl-CoA dehydratase [Desulfobacterales bacterium]
MLEYYTELENGLSKAISGSNKTNARKKFALEMTKLGRDLYSGEKKVSWCGFTAPFDILNTFGVTSCFVEYNGAILASIDKANDYLNDSEQAGYAVDSCAFHKSVFGGVMKGTMPVPDFIVGTTTPCVAGLAVLENMARVYKKPFFVLNIPETDTIDNVQYLKNQLTEMIDFASQHSGVKFDFDKFKESIKLTNKAREIMVKIFDLAKSTPSPVNNKLLKDFGIILPLFFGTEKGVELCNAFYNEFKNTVREGVFREEKIKLLWIQTRIQFRYNLEKILEENFGAKIVVDELNMINWDPIDPENPLESIALRMIKHPYSTTIENRVKKLQDLSKEYGVDGAINPCHWGCRQGTGARGLISGGLKEAGVPVLNLEIDCVDTRNLAEGQLMTRIEAFMEMLLEK